MCGFTHIIIATMFAAQADRDASDHSPHAAIRCVVWRLYAGLYCESARSVHNTYSSLYNVALLLYFATPPPLSSVNSEGGAKNVASAFWSGVPNRGGHLPTLMVKILKFLPMKLLIRFCLPTNVNFVPMPMNTAINHFLCFLVFFVPLSPSLHSRSFTRCVTQRRTMMSTDPASVATILCSAQCPNLLPPHTHCACVIYSIQKLCNISLGFSQGNLSFST